MGKNRAVPLASGAVLLIIAAAVGHTWLVVNQMTSFGYERVSDFAVVGFVVAIGFFVLRAWRRDTGRTFWANLVLLHVLVLIAVTHSLRLFLGGLPCG